MLLHAGHVRFNVVAATQSLGNSETLQGFPICKKGPRVSHNTSVHTANDSHCTVNGVRIDGECNPKIAMKQKKGCLPAEWCHSMTRCVPKSQGSISVNNHRTVTLLNCKNQMAYKRVETGVG